jgi:hypothetical protein
MNRATDLFQRNHEIILTAEAIEPSQPHGAAQAAPVA